MAAARTRDRDRGPVAVAPKSDAYVGLLGISLIALILACVLMALDFWGDYEGKTKAPAVPAYGGLPRTDVGAPGQPPVTTPKDAGGGLVPAPGGQPQPGKNP